MLHIKNHITIKEQETRMVDTITNYITQIHMWVHTINQIKYLSGSTTYIYVYKIVTENTCRFNQPTRPMRLTLYTSSRPRESSRPSRLDSPTSPPAQNRSLSRRNEEMTVFCLE